MDILSAYSSGVFVSTNLMLGSDGESVDGVSEERANNTVTGYPHTKS